jgi:hypothetical protein
MITARPSVADRVCPKCGEELSLVNPTEDVWGLDPSDYDEDADVWFCLCGWSEEATLDESIEEHATNFEWVMSRLRGDRDY